MRQTPMLLTLALVLVACRSEDKVDTDTGEVSDEPVDADGDGSPEDEDCDDNDDRVYPGATEVCNGVDDDCNGDIDDAVGDTWYADEDGDGAGDPEVSAISCEGNEGYVAAATDCDDADAEVNPLADEYCDDIDNDCDGGTDDENSVDAGTWYPDVDLDGYGDLNTPIRACDQPDDTLTFAGDCADEDPDRNPDAIELCDELDNDCDGYTDEPEAEDALEWFVDNDGDGFGDPATTERGCTQPSGTLTEAGDCDDNDPTVNPGEVETCEDGKDNDCDGSANECGLHGVINEADASDATWTGESSSDSAGYGVALTGDMDGDGIGDAVIGAYGNDEAGTSAGKAYVLYGGTSIAGGSFGDEAAITGPEVGDLLGFAVAALGDVDGDGYNDVVVGAQGDDTVDDRAGAAWVWYGGGRETGTASAGDAAVQLLGVEAGDAAGYGVAGVGDLDRDGYDDLMVGAKYALDDAGVTYLLYGATTAWADGTDLADADATFIGDDDDGYVGERFSMTSAGDMDGDGNTDLAMGAYDSDRGASEGGAVMVIGGTGSRWSGDQDLDTADTIYEGPLYSRLGWSVSGGGDVDGDGYDDLLAGGYNYQSAAGVVYILRGSVSATALGAVTARTEAAVTLSGSADGDALGRTLKLTDLDGDGNADIVVSATGVDDGASSGGVVYLVFGGASMATTWDMATDADATIVGTAGSGQLGWSMDAGADMNGDTFPDLLLGSYGEDSYTGAAWLVPGTGL